MPERRRGGRSRRILLWGAGGFVFLQVLTAWFFDYAGFFLRFPQLAQYLEELQARPAAVLCVGSSRFGCCLDTPLLTHTLRQATGDSTLRVKNLSVPVGDFLASECVLRHVLALPGPKPRVVLLEVCPESTNHLNYWVDVHIKRSFRWMDVPENLYGCVRTGNGMRLLTSRALAMYMHREALRDAGWQWLQGLRGAADEPAVAVREADEGASAPSVDWDKVVASRHAVSESVRAQNFESGLKKAGQLLRHYRPGGPAEAALDRLLRLCADHGVAVVLVGAPVSLVHRQTLYTPDIDGAYYAFVHDVCARHGCRFLDLRDALPENLFADNHHATHEGALVLSRRVAQEALVPLWEKPNSTRAPARAAD
jgi:hypothetical protein